MGGGVFRSVTLSCGYGVKFRFFVRGTFFSCAKTWFLIWDIWKIRYAFFEVHRSRFFSMCTIWEILHTTSLAETWAPVKETWVPLKETWVPLKETRFHIKETWVPLKETWVPFKETWVPLKETLFHLKETWVPLKETWVPLKETWVPFKETWVPLEETLFHLKETWVPLKETWVYACTQAAVFRAPNQRWSRRHWFSSKNCWF